MNKIEKRILCGAVGAKLATGALVVVVAMYSIFPIYWMIVSSFRPSVELFSKTTLFPWPFSLENYKQLLALSNYTTYYKNSIIVALGTTLITTLTVLPLSYMLARFRMRWAGIVIRLMLAAYMFPAMLLVIPMFVIFAKLGLFDTLISLIIAQTTITIPLAAWLMWGFFKSIPYELEEAALVDGCTPFKAFLRIVLPVSRSGLIATTLFTFIVSWTDYVYAFTLIFTEERKTLPVGLASMQGMMDMRWGELMAGSSMIAIPSILAFAFVTRYLIQGLSAGAVKG